MHSDSGGIKNYTEILSGIYDFSIDLFKTDPLSANTHTQKKICRWIKKMYKEEINGLPEEVASLFSSETSNYELLSFLKWHYEKLQRLNEVEKQNTEKAIAHFPEDVQSALREVTQNGYYTDDIVFKNGALEITLDDSVSLTRKVIFRNIENHFAFDEETYIRFKNLSRVNNIYSLTAEGYETSQNVTLKFSDVSVEVTLYNCVSSIDFEADPWNTLLFMAYAISAKEIISDKYFNEQEKLLLPLLKEIENLEVWYTPFEKTFCSFPLLKKLTEKYGYSKITALFERLERQQNGSSKYINTAKKISDLLCEITYEPMWREIFEQITASQKNYIVKVEHCCPTDTLNNIRKEITELMETHGFIGEYPDFIKRDKLHGIHLEESYDMLYWIGNKKNAIYRIHCSEYMDDPRYFQVSFLCTAELLRKNEAETDVYNCMFNAKGHKLYHTTNYFLSLDELYDDEEPDSIEMCVNIAVKKAQLKPLTREEKKIDAGKNEKNFSSLFLIFLISGGLFGILMTAAFIIIAALLTLIVGLPHEIASLFTEIPWWFCLLFCWIGFGGTMTLLTYIARKK